ncbi:MAG: hypothetical protein AAFY60_16105, partial [Myxococcota bacterium]
MSLLNWTVLTRDGQSPDEQRIAMVRRIPFQNRAEVLNAFQQMDGMVREGEGRTLADALGAELSDAQMRQVEPYLHDLSFTSADTLDDRIGMVQDALRVNAGGFASRFTHEHGLLRVEMQHLDSLVEGIMRDVDRRRDIDPSAELTPDELQRIHDAVYRTMRSSINTRAELEEFDQTAREIAIWTTAIVASAATMGLGTAPLLGTLTIRGATVPFLSGQAIRGLMITGVATAGAATAADYAADGELDMTGRDYARAGLISTSMVVGFSRLPWVTANQIRWTPQTLRGTLGVIGNYWATGTMAGGIMGATEAWHEERYGDMGGEALNGALWGGAIGGLASMPFLMGGHAMRGLAARYPSLQGTWAFRNAVAVDDAAGAAGAADNSAAAVGDNAAAPVTDEVANVLRATSAASEEASTALAPVSEGVVAGYNRWLNIGRAMDDYVAAVARGVD